MKYLLLLFLCIASIEAYSQTSLYFSYDASGNQVLRDVVCVNCRTNSQVSHKDSMTINGERPSEIVVFPNPVTNYLQVRWENTGNNSIKSIFVYGASGSLLSQLEVKAQKGQISIDFSRYPSGIYVLTAVAADGKVNSFKIIRQ